MELAIPEQDVIDSLFIYEEDQNVIVEEKNKSLEKEIKKVLHRKGDESLFWTSERNLWKEVLDMH